MKVEHWRAIIREAPLPFEVTGDSMYPTLRRGDRIIIEPLDRSPRPGEIVVFLRRQLVSHRFLGGERCRGDNFLDPDPPVPPDRIVGVARYRLRDGRQTALSRRMPLAARAHRLYLRARWIAWRLLRRPGAAEARPPAAAVTPGAAPPFFNGKERMDAKLPPAAGMDSRKCLIGSQVVEVRWESPLPEELAGITRLPAETGASADWKLWIEFREFAGLPTASGNPPDVPAPPAEPGQRCTPTAAGADGGSPAGPPAPIVLVRVTQRIEIDLPARTVRLRLRLPLGKKTRYWFQRDVFGLLASLSGEALLHSSAVVREGKAYVFCADSGTGKSTIARLLRPRHPLINDEVNWLYWEAAGSPRLVNQRYWMEADGPPALPIGGIFLLEQSAGCELAGPVPAAEAFPRLLSTYQGLQPVDPGMAGRAMAITRLLRETPVRRLRFNLDAAEVDRTLFGDDRPAG